MIEAKYCPRCQGGNQEYAAECLFCGQELAVEKTRGGILFGIGVVLLAASFIVWALAILGMVVEDDPVPVMQDWIEVIIGLLVMTIVPIGIGAFLVLRKANAPGHDVL